MRWTWMPAVISLWAVLAASGGPISEARNQLQKSRPGVAFVETGTQITRVYGAAFGSGPSAEQSADRFVQSHSTLFGVPADELVPGNAFNNVYTQPVMYEPQTSTYKFTLVYYTQYKDGLRVYGSDLRLLVRNEPDYPLVLGAASLHDLRGYQVPAAAARSVAEGAAHAAAATFEPGLANFSTSEQVLWAGEVGAEAPPTVALTFIGDGTTRGGEYKKWRFVSDATTGAVLHAENLIVFTDVTGNVSGMATDGPKADFCAPEVPMTLPWARVALQGGNPVYADEFGNFTIPNAGDTPVNVQSFMSGIYFNVATQSGAEETLTTTATPPGPVNFLHNADNTSELFRAQVNAYIQSNRVREFVLQQNPAYPTIATQTGFPVRVNRIDVYCPGNAWYDGSSINFCRAAPYGGTNYPNTAWQAVVFHEYGHHAVACAGSGQGAYGEGMSDCIAMLPYDDAIAAYGFFGDCATGLRTADNTMQYPCVGEIHDCGQLLSACVWSTRNQLVVTEPVNYLTLLSALTVNSILMHSGDQITPQIAIDFLTLDDDDANLYNGTPHFAEITTGFGEHSMWTGLPPAVDLPVSLLSQFNGAGDSGAAYAVAFAGDYAYVANGAAGLLIQNVSIPALPTFVLTVPTTGPAYGVAIAGSRAYVAEGETGLEIFDISNPAAPVWLGLHDTDGWAWGVVVAGQFAFVADDFAGLVMIDVSDPTAPFWHDAYMSDWSAYSLTLAGTRIYVAQGPGGLAIFDITNPAGLAYRGRYRSSKSVFGAAIVGQTAYVASDIAGLEVVNVSNPQATSRQGAYNTRGSARAVAVSGRYAYVADGEAGLEIIDIANAAAPRLLANYDTPGLARGVVLNNYAYIADDTGGVAVLRVGRVGDLNCNAHTNLDDINPFVTRLLEPAQYVTLFPDCPAMNGDINGDAKIDLGDINPFVSLLASMNQ